MNNLSADSQARQSELFSPTGEQTAQGKAAALRCNPSAVLNKQLED
jgi:hypothetical protein